MMAVVALPVLALAVVACGRPAAGVPTAAPTQESAATTVVPVDAAGAAGAACDVTPRQTEGPYYFDIGQVRRDIAEGRPGTPLLVALRLVETGSCEPIPDATVDIWHADAAGQYSGYRGQGDDGIDTSGQTFLRGRQITDADGLVEFETIYPGWYPGRAVHIHFKAYADGRSLVASQMYFPDDITGIVYSAEPYSTRGHQGTTNESDRILTGSPANEALLGHVTPNGAGYVVSLTVGIGR